MVTIYVIGTGKETSSNLTPKTPNPNSPPRKHFVDVWSNLLFETSTFVEDDLTEHGLGFMLLGIGREYRECIPYIIYRYYTPDSIPTSKICRV